MEHICRFILEDVIFFGVNCEGNEPICALPAEEISQQDLFDKGTVVQSQPVRQSGRTMLHCTLSCCLPSCNACTLKLDAGCEIPGVLMHVVRLYIFDKLPWQ